VRALIEAAHDEAWEILVEYRDTLDRLVLELLEKETLSREDMDRICAGVDKRPSMAPYNGFGKRTPSQRPPVLTPAEAAGVNGNGVHGTNGAIQAPVGDVGAPVQRR
jgi:cell division protease FtsH